MMIRGPILKKQMVDYCATFLAIYWVVSIDSVASALKHGGWRGAFITSVGVLLLRNLLSTLFLSLPSKIRDAGGMKCSIINERSREVWWGLASLSLMAAYSFYLFSESSVKNMVLLVQICTGKANLTSKEASILGGDYLMQLFKLAVISYAACLHLLALGTKPKGFRVHPFVKFLMETLFIVLCLLVSNYFDDSLAALAALSCCFHLVTVLQLCKPLKNVGLLDSLLALSLLVAQEFSKNPKHAQTIVFLMSIAIQMFKYMLSPSLPTQYLPSKIPPNYKQRIC